MYVRVDVGVGMRSLSRLRGKLLYEDKTWSMAVTKKKSLNVMEMRCMGNICGLICMDQVRNEVQRRTGTLRELTD